VFLSGRVLACGEFAPEERLELLGAQMMLEITVLHGWTPGWFVRSTLRGSIGLSFK
jgi:hypothetical protein